GHEEGRKRDREDHSEESAERGAPEENRDDDHDRMQAGLVAHDLGSEEGAFENLHRGENTCDQRRQNDTAARLQERERNRDQDSQNDTEVGDDIEQSENQSENDTEAQSGEREPDRQQNADHHGDQQLS